MGQTGAISPVLTEAGQAYSTVFAPEAFILVCALCLLGYERLAPGHGTGDLGAKLGALAFGWAVGLAVYKGVPLAVGPVPKWINDALGSVGLVIGLAVIGVVWRRQDWGGFVPPFAGLLVAVSVPHLLITPVWDISSHVLYTVVPAGALVVLDRRFAVLAVVPLGMVLARPLAGVHTWPQSIAGLGLGVVAVVAFARSRWANPHRRTMPPANRFGNPPGE